MDSDLFLFPKLPLFFYNTETRQKERFSPHVDNQVRMYTCGPTVYNYAHIGNFRTYVFEDILRRTLKFFGYHVMQVMNLTDVDDKTILGTIDTGKSLQEFTRPFKNAFFVDLQTLGIERVEYYPAATDYIETMIDFIQTLLDKGIAYKSKDKSIYYSIQKFPRYGRLSHLKLGELQAGAGDSRIVSDEYEKEHVGDFVLWKAYDPNRDGKVYWESPFGPGRPGWHLECSAMAQALLGPMLDIHVGAVDNIFPHHENEIAQSEAFSGKPFVSLWLHSEHLIVNQKKMSKSLGNFYTLRDLFERHYQGREVRYMLMHTHYRTQLNFTFEGMEGAKRAVERLQDFVGRMQACADPQMAPTKGCRTLLQETIQKFSEAMADDLNISVALAALFEMMHLVNSLVSTTSFNGGDACEVLFVLQEFNRILGIFSFSQEEEIPASLQALLQEREKARLSKQWALADQLRADIQGAGYEIEDTDKGPRLKKMRSK